MRKSSSSKYVIAALVAATFGLTAGTALAQTTPQNPSSTASNNRHASKKSVRQLSSQSKEMRVAKAEHRVRKGEHTQRSHVHTRKAHHANTTPPPR